MHLRCPHCQNPIELADVPSSGEVLCAGCGSSFQLANFSTATWEKPTNKRIGKFEVLGTVGHGAFGTVLKAHDTELDRIVAIKIPRASNVGQGQDDVDRFLREARAVAQLRHPLIITIHEVGVTDLPSPLVGEGPGVRGMPYLVSDFVEGVTLADHLTARGFSFTESAQLLADVADALQYAHSLGVVHRDVKPSNVMIQRAGSVSDGQAQPVANAFGSDLKPVLMDFGLAKRDAGEITMTIDGQILGTPAYMSPEQARGEGHRVDGRSDVYSLGVILYQLLTGELPFRGNKSMLLHQVLHEEPKSPRKLNDKIPRDLETISLKAMAKEPGRRYGSAKEMAEDLRRWLAGEPILARPVGAVERTWRWCKRKPALAAANAAVFVALITFVAAFLVVRASLEQEQIERGKAQELAKEKEKLAKDADERREHAESLAVRIEFEHYFSKAEERPDLALVGMASLLPKAARLKDHSLEESLRLHLGAWRGRLARLSAICQHEQGIRAVALSADGKLALTAGADMKAHLWETATGNSKRTLLHLEAFNAVALSADGKTALTGDIGKAAPLWETATGKPIGPPLQHQAAEVHGVVLSADGKTALTLSQGGKTAQLWDLATGQPLGSPLPHNGAILAIALSADGTTALTGHDEGAQLWKTATRKPFGHLIQHTNGVCAVALSGNGKTALTGSFNKTARMWDTATGMPIGRPLQHQGLVRAVALSSDGTTALTGSDDMSAQLWDAKTGEAMGPPLLHQDTVRAVALSADGQMALTGSSDKSARLWDVAAYKAIAPLRQFQGTWAALSADGTKALTSSGKTARLWDTATCKPIGPALSHEHGIVNVALSADGKTALTASADTTVGDADKTCRLWNPSTGDPIGQPLQHELRVQGLALSANGKLAFTGSYDGTARLWDGVTSNSIGPPIRHGKVGWTVGHNVFTAVALSADGKFALTGSYGKAAQIWEAATGKPVGPPMLHRGAVTAVALRPDGKIAVSGSIDRTARLWDTATGTPIGPPLQHQGSVRGVGLSNDGKLALTGSEDNTARLWETATGKLIGSPMLHPDRVLAVALSADSKMALTGSSDNTARLWKVPHPVRGDPERIMLWTQVITGLEVDELTAVRVLDAAAWQQRRQRLQELGGPPVLD